jgi:hypothetical protein
MAAVGSGAGLMKLFSWLRRRPQGSMEGVKEALQNEHRGDLVNHRAAISTLVAGRIQVTMSLGGGEPFVPQRDRNSGLALKILGQALRLEGLRADIARHVQRIAHHHLGAAIFPHDPGQGVHVLSPVLAHDGEDRLRRQPQFVGNRYSDAAVSNIQAQDAARRPVLWAITLLGLFSRLPHQSPQLRLPPDGCSYRIIKS